jgi:hypothetical protein
MEDEGFVQVAESSNCTQYTFIANAYNSFDAYSLEAGDFVNINLPGVDQSSENRIYSINNTGSFAQMKVLMDSYDAISNCDEQSYTTIENQTNITLMEIPNGYDLCGVCGGDNTTCVPDCNGIWGGDASLDECDVCDNNPGNDCIQDECGVWGGSGMIDNCDVCDSDSSNDCILDCNNDWGGTALPDDCGFCSGGNTGLEYNGYLGCDGNCFSGLELDTCGVCDGDNTSCQMLGDINGDGIINVVDIVALVTMILGGEYNVLADLNEDGIVNVVDIVQMVDWILNGIPQTMFI